MKPDYINQASDRESFSRGTDAMTRQKSNNYLAIDRLASSIVDEILNMTDEEILAEVTADGDDPKQIAQETKDIFERAGFYDSPGFAPPINEVTTITGNVWDGEGP